jgi:hypothetical protein
MIEYANLVFYGIFAVEMILKLIAYGVNEYVRDRFNKFDGLIVIVSTIELILVYMEIGDTHKSAVSAMRAFRLLRLFKFAKKWTQLQNLLITMGRTLSDIGYFCFLFLLVMLIYSLIGMELYAYRI